MSKKITNQGAAKLVAREDSKDEKGNVVRCGGKEVVINPLATVTVSDELAARLLNYKHIFEVGPDGIVPKTKVAKPVIPAGVGQAPKPEEVAAAKKGK